MTPPPSSPVRRADTVEPEIVCLGNLTIDDIVLPDGTLKPGTCGGDALYSAFGAVQWTNNVKIVAPIGTDFPEANLSLLEQRGWSLEGFARRSVPSIHNTIKYAAGGQRYFTLQSDPQNFFVLSPGFADIPNEWRGAEGFHIAAMELAAQEALASHLGGRGATVSLDPKFEFIAGNEARVRALIGKVDVFMPSHVEVEALQGHTDHKRAAVELARLGCPIIVIKREAAGSLIFDGRRDIFIEIPAVETAVVDATGAGDAYCGGFLAHYLKTGDLREAGLAAAVSASLAIEAFGSLHMLDIGRDEAKKRLARFSQQAQRTA